MRTIIPKDALLLPKEAKQVFKGVIYDVYQWEQEMYDGTLETFEMLKRADTVEILLIKDDRILVQHQEQPHLGLFTSFPGGRNDHEGDTELDAAKRELREESGYLCSTWKLIEALQPHAKVDQIIYTFVASDITDQVPLQLDAGEKIENLWLTLEEFRKLIATTKFRSRSAHFLENIEGIHDLLELPEYTP